MKRREFITLLGGSVAAWPCPVGAQQQSIPLLGFLYFGTPGAAAGAVAAFRKALGDSGYIEGRDVAIEVRIAERQVDLASEHAADLVRRQAAVIIPAGSQHAVFAAMAATSTIPIVFVMSDDPVKYGIVASFNRPGGNVTGVHFRVGELAGKRLNLLLDLVPQATTVAYLAGPRVPPLFEDLTSEMEAAAHALGRKIIAMETDGDVDFEAVFAALVQRQADALIVGGFSFFLEPRNRNKILELAARHKIPAMYPNRQYTAAGGLMSYGANIQDVYRTLSSQIGQILKGAKPTQIPVQQPARYELVINKKTAQSLGIQIPRILLVFTNEVIE
jgi:putative tryptophan/tyrosine transport system substrate-binding protein